MKHFIKPAHSQLFIIDFSLFGYSLSYVINYICFLSQIGEMN